GALALRLRHHRRRAPPALQRAVQQLQRADQGRRARAGCARRAPGIAAPPGSVSVTRLSPAEASAHVLAGVAPLGEETVALPEALGRVLAQDIESPVSLPP